VLQNDPPKKAATGDRQLLSLKSVLTESDIVSLHTPLTCEGPYATQHLANFDFFNQVKPGSIFINAARGEVTDTEALLKAMEPGRVALSILDVWENEPGCPLPMLQRTDLGTPHIAGYSFEGRAEGTQMIYREACAFFKKQAQWTWAEFATDPAPIEVVTKNRPRKDVLEEVVRQAYDIEKDDRAFRGHIDQDAEKRMAKFMALRLDYPGRREFRAFEVRVDDPLNETSEALAQLGFRVR
ncbi:MAG TPA: DUF3410 domain-containing protein, partial [Nitrospiria bacterium]|nr:DUF3410 domain-containing protein [Nitrospiria bacterium]